MRSITLTRRIAARPAIVFEALTTVEGIMSWWGPEDVPVILAEIDARVGGAYRVRFRTLDGREHEACGEYLEIDPPRRLAMSWRYADGGEADEFGRVSRVEFELRPIDGGAELTLTHRDLHTEVSAESHGWGWGGSLDKLVARLGGAPQATSDQGH